MKIIMVLSNAFDPDPRVYKEAKTLIDLGHEVEIYSWDRINEKLEIEIYDEIYIKRYNMRSEYGAGYRQFIPYIKFVSKVYKDLKKEHIKIIHCHDFDTLLIGILLKRHNKSINIIYDQHDVFYQYFDMRKGIINKMVSYLIRKLEKRALKKVWKHIVVTPKMKELYGNKSNIVIIDNAPYRNSFKSIEKLKRNNKVIGFIGSVRHYKELKYLINAVQKHNGLVEIFIAGRGTELENLKEYCKENTRMFVEFFGEFHIDDLEKLYKKIDFTYAVYPETAYISMPNKFYESIITETPIIAELKTEFGEIVKKEKLGFTINRDECIEKQLNNIIVSMLNNEAEINEMKKNMQNIKDEYFWDNNIDKLSNIYGE